MRTDLVVNDTEYIIDTQTCICPGKRNKMQKRIKLDYNYHKNKFTKIEAPRGSGKTTVLIDIALSHISENILIIADHSTQAYHIKKHIDKILNCQKDLIRGNIIYTSRDTYNHQLLKGEFNLILIDECVGMDLNVGKYTNVLQIYTDSTARTIKYTAGDFDDMYPEGFLDGQIKYLSVDQFNTFYY